ncbi:DUF2996 family protein [Tasmannia lanceolata]|uniref:DUF2996 family protein n=1 Tax=Tasmannia lanceolata TaxID=3420 RepID=UPI0040632096
MISSSMASRSINNMYSSPLPRSIKASSGFPLVSSVLQQWRLCRRSVGKVVCEAVKESSTATVAETKEVATTMTTGSEAPAKPKRAAKVPAKPLPELMEEDVIPSLKAILERQHDLSQIQLSFQDNTLEGSFVKKGISYCFWAFFPDGVVTGSKGFAVSSYGQGPSTVEPFLIDEKKITSRHVVFWVEKRLAAQGILPVWEE